MAYRNYATAVSHIVDTNGQGDFTTIGAALAAASSGQTIFIKDGTYTENLTLKGGVNLVSWSDALNYDGAGSGSVTIIGKLTASFSSGTAVLSGLNIHTNSDNAIATSSSGFLYIIGCYFFSQTNAIFNLSGTGRCHLYYCTGSVNNASASFITSSVTGGSIRIEESVFTDTAAGGSGASTFSSSQSIEIVGGKWATQITLSGTCALNVYQCVLNTVLAAATPCVSAGAGTITSLANCTISSTAANALTGAGTINYGGCTFVNTATTNGSSETYYILGHKQGGTDVSVPGTAGNVLTSDGTNWTSKNPAYPITPYVVGPIGFAPYQTIQTALNAANAASGGIVYVQSGTYTENLTLYGTTQVIGVPGNSDSGTSGNSTIISGVHTPPLTGSFTFANVRLNSATHIFSSAGAGSAALILINVFTALTNGFIFNLTNWTGTFVTYNVGDGSTNNGVVTNSGGATCFFVSATHGAGTGQTMVTSGPVEMQEVDLNCPWNSGTGTTIEADYNVFSQSITCSNNSTGEFSYCRFSTGSSTAFTMSSSASITLSNIIIDTSANPGIDGSGAGTLTLDNISFTQNSSIANTLTLATTGAFYPAGNVGPSGNVWTSNGVGVPPTFQPPATFSSINVQTFTGAGTYTYTRSAGVKYALLEVVGGGGAGGGATTSGPDTSSGAGGAYGGYSKKIITSAALGATQTITIGAGGTPGAAGNNPGGTGGSSSIGAIISATGGTGGGGAGDGNIAFGIGGLGGAGTGGDINVNGSPGGNGLSLNIGGVGGGGWSGDGASGIYGAGGISLVWGTTSAGNAGISYGSGGSGGSSYNFGGDVAGGAGADGLAIITEYI